jgi:predicted ATPase
MEGPRVLYWLYESARAYALQKLWDEGELDTITLRYDRNIIHLPSPCGEDRPKSESGDIRRDVACCRRSVSALGMST